MNNLISNIQMCIGNHLGGSTSLWWYRLAANRGNVKAQYMIAESYIGCLTHFHGKDEYNLYKAISSNTLNNSLKEGLEWLLKAVQQGRHSFSGNFVGFEKDCKWKRDSEWWYLCACHVIGEMHYFGIGVEKNYKESFKWFLREANSEGNLYFDPYYQIGFMYEHGQGCKKSYEKAIECYKKPLNTESCYRLGRLYYTGSGTDKNYNESFKYFSMAADARDQESKVMIGIMTAKGEGTKKNNKKALNLYKAAEKEASSPRSCGYGVEYLLGKVYHMGYGTKQDFTKAIYWYERAANRGYERAYKRLDNIYYHLANSYYHLGTESQKEEEDEDGFLAFNDNFRAAFEWYTKLAEKGDVRCQSNIGSMYINGQGVLEDYKEAYAWLYIAKEQDYKSAEKKLDHLLKIMSKEDLVEAQELSKEYYKKYVK